MEPGLKSIRNNAVIKRKDSNCVRILFDQGEAATAENFSVCFSNL